jgi:hypothetical protein
VATPTLAAPPATARKMMMIGGVGAGAVTGTGATGGTVLVVKAWSASTATKTKYDAVSLEAAKTNVFTTPNAKVGGQNVFVANWGLITWNGSTLRPKGGQGTRDDITLIPLN